MLPANPLSRRNVGKFAAAIVFAATLSACAPPAEVTKTTPAETEASLEARARAIHQSALVLDAHADIVVPSTAANFLSADGLSKVDPTKLKAGGVGAVVMSIAVGPGARTRAADAEARKEADEKLAAIEALAAANSDTVAIAKSADEILSIRASGKTALILGFQNARSLEGKVSALDTFYQAGARVFALNHLAHNDFSDSSRPFHDPKTRLYEPDLNRGLSALGLAAIDRINELGGVVDVSQASKASTLATIARSKTPVIASHSNVRAISDATRNLSDEEIDRIGETGGVIHVAPFSAYLINFSTPEKLAAIAKARSAAGLPPTYSYPYELYWELSDPAAKETFSKAIREALGPATVDIMIDHIDYIVKRIGIDHVGIGTDFNHGSGIEGYQDAADSFAVTLGLVRRGYSEEDIKKIWGGNFIRVMRQAEKYAADLKAKPSP
ncbi:MAG: membrane dipeptidase [Hyphomonadaceae bacterium]